MKTLSIILISAIVVLIVSLLVINLFTSRSIKTEVVIDSSADKVWNELMAHGDYSEWNSFIKCITGSSLEGENLSVTIQNPGNDPLDFRPVVLVNKTNQEFRWVGKLLIKGVFDGEHYFILEQMNDNQTRFILGENFTGILSGLLLNMIARDTKHGFILMNEALKNLVES